jgi:endonuclease/exonuclease/phosphatase family metal-dependent hydrolase
MVFKRQICLTVFCIFYSSCTDLALFEKEEKLIFTFENYIKPKIFQTIDTLTFLTINIQLGFPRDISPWNENNIGGTIENLDNIIEAIKSIDPDIVGLQEVARDRSNTQVKSQVQYIAKKIGMNYAYGDDGEIGTNHPFSSGFWGNAILTKYEISGIENPEIHYYNRYISRHCLLATIKLNGQHHLSVLNTHFVADSSPSEFLIQTQKVSEIANNEVNPTVILADLNLAPGRSELFSIRENFYFILEEIDSRNTDQVKAVGTANGFESSPKNSSDYK